MFSPGLFVSRYITILYINSFICSINGRLIEGINEPLALKYCKHAYSVCSCDYSFDCCIAGLGCRARGHHMKNVWDEVPRSRSAGVKKFPCVSSVRKDGRYRNMKTLVSSERQQGGGRWDCSK